MTAPVANTVPITFKSKGISETPVRLQRVGGQISPLLQVLDESGVVIASPIDANGNFSYVIPGVVPSTVVAIQAAVDGAPSGGVIQLAAGAYLGGAGIVPVGGITLAGRGLGVTYLSNTDTLGVVNTVVLEGLYHITQDEVIEEMTIHSQTYGGSNAGIYAHLTQGVIVRHVQVTRHKYGLYTDAAEQFAFYDCWFDTCTVAAAWLTGSTPGLYCSNYHKFYNCIFQGAPYGLVIENAAGNVAFWNCPFYTNTVAAVYVPATAVGVVNAIFENCWFEANTKSLDLRGGSGFTFRNCEFSNAAYAVEPTNFNHPGLWLDGCADGGNGNGYLVAPGIDYKLTNANSGYPRAQAQVAGKYEAVEYPPVRGSREKALALPTDMSTWTTPATGGQPDPYGGTNGYRVGAGGSALHELTLNGGAAIGGQTYTLQMRVKTTGRVKLQLINSTGADIVAFKWISVPQGDWRFVHYTFTWPTGLTDPAAFIYVTADVGHAYCYRPTINPTSSPITELPSGRDMSSWIGDYEVFGVNQNLRVSVNNAAPASGTWRVGDEAVNYAPVAGGTDRWRCTTAGTPGTWKAVAVAA